MGSLALELTLTAMGSKQLVGHSEAEAYLRVNRNTGESSPYTFGLGFRKVKKYIPYMCKNPKLDRSVTAANIWTIAVEGRVLVVS